MWREERSSLRFVSPFLILKWNKNPVRFVPPQGSLGGAILVLAEGGTRDRCPKCRGVTRIHSSLDEVRGLRVKRGRGRVGLDVDFQAFPAPGYREPSKTTIGGVDHG